MPRKNREKVGKILIVDDQIGDLEWLLDTLDSRGYQYDLAEHTQKGRELLDEVKAGTKSYDLAIFDMMVALMDIRDLAKMDPKTLDDSVDAGLQLCRYARRTLELTEKELRIVCLSARPDRDNFRPELEQLGIPLFPRIPSGDEESIRNYIETKLPSLKV